MMLAVPLSFRKSKTHREISPLTISLKLTIFPQKRVIVVGAIDDILVH